MQVGIEKSKMKENLSEYIPRKIMQETIFNPRYRSIDKIGSGSFGEIHKVYDIIDKKLRAVKIEKKDKRGSTGMLAKEAFIMRQMSNCHHFPRLIEDKSTETGQVSDTMQFIIMSFLGSNLESLKKKFNTLSHYTTLLIGSQMVEALMLMHGKGFLHRDIKPENFVIGTDGNHHNIYIIDFGLSKRYIDASKNHIQEDNNKGLVGTARYTSINSHRGVEQSRRDDLEALGYVLIYLAKGELPWQNLTQEKREEKFEQIKKLKVETSIDTLTDGLPLSFRKYMEHIRSLKFEEEPKYKELQESFLKDAITIQQEQKIQLESSHCLDWCVRGSCSIEKSYADKIARKKAEESNAKKESQANMVSSPGMVNQHVEESNPSDKGRRETQFTETPNFYEDTVEKSKKNLGVFEVPLFRTDQSLAISKNSVVTVGTFIGGSAVAAGGGGLNGIDLYQSALIQKPNSANQPIGSGVLGDEANAFLSQEFGQHSENSSQYNNVSNEYTPMQDEQVVVQKVVKSSPVQFSVKDNKNSNNNNQSGDVRYPDA